jgi:ankyrin repeat protein
VKRAVIFGGSKKKKNRQQTNTPNASSQIHTWAPSPPGPRGRRETNGSRAGSTEPGSTVSRHEAMPASSGSMRQEQASSSLSATLMATSGTMRKHQRSLTERVAASCEKMTPNAKWFNLVRKSDYKGVRDSIRDGSAPLNATDSQGYTALMRCCVSGQLLEVLLACTDLDVNQSSAADGSTALLLAARHRSARTVHALLRRGASFTRDARGCSILHRAAANSDPAVVRLLLSAQADPCARDREGRCALATAVLQGNEGSAVALLQWQHSWAAKGVLRAAAAATTTTRSSSSSTSSAPSEQSLASITTSTGTLGLDSLPDDCLDLILLHLARGGTVRSHDMSCRVHDGADSQNCRNRSGGDGDGSSEAVAGHRATGTSGARVDGASIVASVAASLVAPAPAMKTHNPRFSFLASAAIGCVCTRLRALCRRRTVSAWLSAEGINAPIACYLPRGNHTTLLHAAAAEGMEDTAELLLLRGAYPLAVDSRGRRPLQVARGRASLIAKLTEAQAAAEATSAESHDERAQQQAWATMAVHLN